MANAGDLKSPEVTPLAGSSPALGTVALKQLRSNGFYLVLTSVSRMSPYVALVSLRGEFRTSALE